ncbi:MAG: site-2 protease family protein [Anaerolineae bacterium]|nr:site-2 protease family protein [Anaerolineae bacterium]
MGLFSITTLVGRAIGLILGFTLHEWGHAWSAYRLGDTTAARQGRLSLDPRVHLEPMGIILALLVGFGWAKPVPVNSMAFYPNQKRGLVIVALAGPIMNLLLALGFGIIVRLMIGAGLDSGFLYEVVATIVFFNLVLFLFNLLPFAPLDGYKIAVGTLPRKTANWFLHYEKETTLALVLLLMAGIISPLLNVIWIVLGPPLRFLFQLFTGV